MKVLFILNDAPYGLERNYNALRLASSLAKKNVELKVFLFSDAVLCAKQGQSVPQGYYNIETMLKNLITHHTEIGLCSSCMNAHGMKDEEMMGGTKRSSMDELSEWTIWADKVIAF
ncbi:MAG TPA: DsrE family protein [Candidatus Babeliales bacterium]|nr:DsrE family protein [Candidatus Babeliales bacterium]